MDGPLDAAVEPCVVTAGSQRDEVFFVLEVFHLFVYEWLVIAQVHAYSVVLGGGGAVGGFQMLSGSEDSG